MSIERLIAEKLSYSRNKREKLNPLLFDENDNLKSDVKDRVLKIVEEFLKYIQVDIKVLDVRLVGSNAAYNYSNHSDLDIHIVTNIADISDPEIIARLYFDAIKKNFKDSYDIKIKGIDVELYVEDVNTSSISNGVYSVTSGAWIKDPAPTVTPTDEEVAEAEEIEEEMISRIKKCKTDKELEDLIDHLYILRKDSLSKYGETGPGNLAFKSLRNKGILDNIKKVLRSATSRELSLESRKVKEGNSILSTNYSNVRKRSLFEELQGSTFIETENFQKEWKDLGLDDEDLRELENIITKFHPDTIPIVKGALYKVRFSLSDFNRGKSSSNRAYYVDVLEGDRIYLLTVYSKSGKDNLTKEQLNALKEIIKSLKDEVRR